MDSLTIQVPLGRSATASVFVVRSGERTSRLLRLKMWHAPAPSTFLDRVQDLQERLAAWPQDAMPPPLGASVSADGCPSVVSEFRQGMPITERVRSARLDSGALLRSLQSLFALTLTAHARGLVHGSVAGGNVLVERESSDLCLLDFGLAPLLAPEVPDTQFAASDIVGFTALERTLCELSSGLVRPPSL
jgi:hypothetical protein